MSSTVEQLAEQALQLSFGERAELADRLLRSLEVPGVEVSEDEAARSWADVALQRSNDVHEGRVQSIDWDDAKERLRKRLGYKPAG